MFCLRLLLWTEGNSKIISSYVIEKDNKLFPKEIHHERNDKIISSGENFQIFIVINVQKIKYAQLNDLFRRQIIQIALLRQDVK